MPISPLPILFPLLLIAVPLLCLLRSPRAFRLASAGSVLVLAVSLLSIFVPGWILEVEAESGDPESMYELARWSENHVEDLHAFLPWPGSPDTATGYAWLERAAAHDYPPAVYALGVRIKHGIFVPRPEKWHGPDGNSFPQPDRGQPLIDKALRLGYRPKVEERWFYAYEFRR